jgi:hypothetical protein
MRPKLEIDNERIGINMKNHPTIAEVLQQEEDEQARLEANAPEPKFIVRLVIGLCLIISVAYYIAFVMVPR